MKTISKYFFNFILFIERILVAGFKRNTGMFYSELIYHYDGQPNTGYVVYQGYNMFWFKLRKKVGLAVDDEDLEKMKNEYRMFSWTKV